MVRFFTSFLFFSFLYSNNFDSSLENARIFNIKNYILKENRINRCFNKIVLETGKILSNDLKNKLITYCSLSPTTFLNESGIDVSLATSSSSLSICNMIDYDSSSRAKKFYNSNQFKYINSYTIDDGFQLCTIYNFPSSIIKLLNIKDRLDLSGSNYFGLLPLASSQKWFKPDGRGDIDIFVKINNRWSKLNENNKLIPFIVFSSFNEMKKFKSASRGSIAYIVHDNIAKKFIFDSFKWIPFRGIDQNIKKDSSLIINY
jgi:hypothetical protein